MRVCLGASTLFSIRLDNLFLKMCLSERERDTLCILLPFLVATHVRGEIFKSSKNDSSKNLAFNQSYFNMTMLSYKLNLYSKQNDCKASNINSLSVQL